MISRNPKGKSKPGKFSSAVCTATESSMFRHILAEHGDDSSVCEFSARCLISTPASGVFLSELDVQSDAKFSRVSLALGKSTNSEEIIFEFKSAVPMLDDRNMRHEESCRYVGMRS
jgi:hypothetical protein